MGRKYECVRNVPETVVWALERCEEIVLLDAWLRVKRRIQPKEHWALDFERSLFEDGNHVGQRHLDSINRHLRRTHAMPVVFAETNPTAYICRDSKERRKRDRLELRDWLEGMDFLRRTRAAGEARQTMDSLEPARQTYEQWRTTSWRSKVASAGNDNERRFKRFEPVAQLPPARVEFPAMTSPVMSIEMAMKLLEQTTDQQTKNRLVRVIATSIFGSKSA